MGIGNLIAVLPQQPQLHAVSSVPAGFFPMALLTPDVPRNLSIV